jgi:hypothetical protein
MADEEKIPEDEPRAEAEAPEVQPADPPEETPSEPERPALLNKLRGIAGFEDVQDEDTAIERLIESHRQASAAGHQIEYLSKMADLGNKYLQDKISPPAAEPPKPTEEGPWYEKSFKAATYNPLWDHFLTKDEQGQDTFGPGTPPDVQQDYVAYQQALRENLQHFGANPGQFIAPLLEEAERRAEDRARKVFEEQTAERDKQQYIRNVEQQNEEWLYAKDATGNRIPDGQGSWVPSPYGNRMQELIAEVSAPPEQGGWGVSSPQARWNAAVTLLNQEIMQQQAQQQQQPPTPAAPVPTVDEQADEKRRDLLKRNRALSSRSTNRSGSEQPSHKPAPAQNGTINFRDRLRARLEKDGFTETA